MLKYQILTHADETPFGVLVFISGDPSSHYASGAREFFRDWSRHRPHWIQQTEPDTALLHGLKYDAPADMEPYAARQAIRAELHDLFTAYYSKWGAYHVEPNPRILESLVSADIGHCMTQVVVFCLENEYKYSPYQWDDAENTETRTYTRDQWRPIYDGATETWTYYVIDEDGDDEERFSVTAAEVRQILELEDPAEDVSDLSEYNHTDILEAKGHKNPYAILDEDQEPEYEEEAAEVYEWWAVDGRLFEWLKDAGECVIDGRPRVWGRQGTGQAIDSDEVLARVAREHGILYGQKNAWLAEGYDEKPKTYVSISGPKPYDDCFTSVLYVGDNLSLAIKEARKDKADKEVWVETWQAGKCISTLDI